MNEKGGRPRPAQRGRGGKRAGACPVCGQPGAPRFRPFCSATCADIDLGRWLRGSYRVATEEAAADKQEDEPAD